MLLIWFLRGEKRLASARGPAVVVVVGVMTPPSSAGASEAVNQEMETIPSRAPRHRSVLYTLPVRAKWPSSGYRVAPTPNGLPSAPRGGGGAAGVKEVARRRGVKAVAAGGGVEIL